MRTSSGARGSSESISLLNGDAAKRIVINGPGRNRSQHQRPLLRLFIHGGGDVDHWRARSERRRYHHEYACRNDLCAELKSVDRHRQRTQLLDLLARAEEQRLTWTDRRAQRPQADTRAIVAHVALHHDLAVVVQLRDAEGARHDAVAARDAA